jgi:hypothetical protein
MNLEAEIGGVPEPKVSWLKDGKQLTDAGPRTVYNGRKVMLCLADVQEKDEGKYTLVAENHAGRVETSFDLKVFHLLVKPIISNAFEDTTASDGESLRLKATVEGYPKPTVTWYR